MAVSRISARRLQFRALGNEIHIRHTVGFDRCPDRLGLMNPLAMLLESITRTARYGEQMKSWFIEPWGSRLRIKVTKPKVRS